MRRQTILLTLFLVFGGLCLPAALPGGVDSAHAQRRGKGKKKKKGKAPAAESKKPKVFDFTGLDVAGQLRTPQLLYFLDRANEELQRASLERRSFIPEMVRSLDEEAL